MYSRRGRQKTGEKVSEWAGGLLDACVSAVAQFCQVRQCRSRMHTVLGSEASPVLLPSASRMDPYKQNLTAIAPEGPMRQHTSPQQKCQTSAGRPAEDLDGRAAPALPWPGTLMAT